MRPIHGSRLYHYGEIGIRGVFVTEILSDKISVLSTKMIFRRAKDLVDVYALTHCVRVITSDIFDLYKKNPERGIGAFYEFSHRRPDVKHAYEKLRGVENKPPFDQIYDYLSIFIQPFANRDMAPRIWNSSELTWDASFEKERSSTDERTKPKNKSDRDSR